MKPAIVTAIACLAAAACIRMPGPADVSQVPYRGWSCDQLSQEVVRTDAGLTKGEKNAIEQVMVAKNCIHPLAAETE